MRRIIVIAAIITAAVGCRVKCGSTAAPQGPEEIRVDLTGGICRPANVGDPDADASGFVTFECITSDAVDLPHLHAGDRHSPALFVRVPVADAARFLMAHGGLRRHAAPTPREQDL